MTEQVFDVAELMSLGQARKLLPTTDGRRISIRSIWRWSHYGLRVSGGAIIRLRTMKLGQRLFTSRAWIEEFATALNPRNQKNPQPSNVRSTHIDRAESRLRMRGYLRR